MPAPMWAYLSAGAREGRTRDENRAAWADVRFRPRVMRGTGAVATETTLLGQRVATPLGVAPSSMQRVIDDDGEKAMAAGCAQAGALHVVSSNAGHVFVDIANAGREAASGTPWWLQVYVPPDRHSTAPVLAAAVDAGASAIVLTADTPYPGTKYAPAEEDWAGIDLSWHRRNFARPGEARQARDLAPADIEWLASSTGLPIVVKGVLRADDARRCVDAGARAVYVSNHGGRQLDRAVTSCSALPEVVAEVGDEVEVYVDGGVRSGLDVLAALSLGARGVLVGRPALYALAAGGSGGVAGLLRVLAEELSEALELAGCTRLEDANTLR
ncbi:alpha-hydroxy-acid oxidizing protein [Nocardioides sp. CBS4Y-1]|uniref:Alpha-hydroxy-acid oxidizing protein n=2 Tax=Nocardioides acrostichi TaxID=2784339 RepID=A0A930UYX1_9ACTN|nr:alpha-hydroxy-acid oxidizing protein [Nocardioides acrostichi]